MDYDLQSIAGARRAAESAWDAYLKFREFSREDIDAIVDAMARAIEPQARRLAEIAVEESGCGNVEDKRIKNLFNSLSVAQWLRTVKTRGILWRDDITKIAAIGEPMGVIAALIPVTNPTSTVIYKVISAIKSGNAIICAPHPRGIRCGMETVEIMAQAAEQLNAPTGLIQCLSEVTIAGTTELMKHRRTSLVLATGGPQMVKAAYSSGKPTLAVGPGNVPCYVHRSKKRDLDEVAEQIIMSKSFDYGTACVSEQSVIADQPISRTLQSEMKLRGAYFCTERESNRIADVIFSGKMINPDRVGQAPEVIAKLAGIELPPKTRILVTPQSQVGWQAPLSHEKLNPILAWYEAKNESDGYQLSRDIVRFGGWGHTAVIHSDDSASIARYSDLPVGRVLVNTPAILGGMGYSTDLEPSFMLGTGTWSGSVTSDNVTALHLINIKRVAYESRDWRDILNEFGE